MYRKHSPRQNTGLNFHRNAKRFPNKNRIATIDSTPCFPTPSMFDDSGSEDETDSYRSGDTGPHNTSCIIPSISLQYGTSDRSPKKCSERDGAKRHAKSNSRFVQVDTQTADRGGEQRLPRRGAHAKKHGPDIESCQRIDGEP